MPGDSFIPPPSLPSMAFSDSMKVENRLTILHGTTRSPAPSSSSSPSSSSEFILSSDGNAEFDRKRNDVFANLGTLEQKHEAFVKANGNNKRMRDLADACVKPDDTDAPEERFDKRLFDEAKKRSKESDGFPSFRNIHKNVKGVVCREERSRGETTTSSSSSSTSSSPPATSSSSFKVPRGVPNRNQGGNRNGGGGAADFRRRRDNRPEKPDFMKNPEKWRRYSLEDAKDVTEASNSAAAFAFLNELKERKERKGGDDDDDDDEKGERDGDGKELPTKIVFKAPTGGSRVKPKSTTVSRRIVGDDEEEEEEREEEEEEVEGEEKEAMADAPISGVEMEDADDEGKNGEGESSFVSGSLGSKLVMKEYVVGGEKEGKTRRKKEKPAIGKEIKLSHLDDEDGEDDDD